MRQSRFREGSLDRRPAFAEMLPPLVVERYERRVRHRPRDQHSLGGGESQMGGPDFPHASRAHEQEGDAHVGPGRDLLHTVEPYAIAGDVDRVTIVSGDEESDDGPAIAAWRAVARRCAR